MELRFNLNGKARKPLVEALSDILGQDVKYLGAPTYGYQIGEYNVDRDIPPNFICFEHSL